MEQPSLISQQLLTSQSGASMSGDLKHPSKAIPKGTLYGLGLTFALYSIVILAMAATITRDSFYNNTNVIQLVSCRHPLSIARIMGRRMCWLRWVATALSGDEARFIHSPPRANNLIPDIGGCRFNICKC